MIFERLEARYVTPEMRNIFSLGDVNGLPREIGPYRDMIVLMGEAQSGAIGYSAIDTTKYPVYGSESTIEAWALLNEVGQNFLDKDFQNPREAVGSLGFLMDHTIFQGAFANLYLDTEANDKNVPLYSLVGGQKEAVEVGISISKNESAERISEIIEVEKYRRIKIKVSPTLDDLDKVTQIKGEHPDIMLMVDANSSFDSENPDHERLLFGYADLDLLMIEQPLAHNDIYNHIKLQDQFRKSKSPGRICLDESIHSMKDLQMAVIGGIPIINVKVTRVGGMDIAQDMLDYCNYHGIDTWIGGMMELTAPGKAHSLAMASHPGITLPSDISGTSAYFKEGQDPCVEPMEREANGAYIKVPRVPGRGWEVHERILDEITKETIVFDSKHATIHYPSIYRGVLLE